MKRSAGITISVVISILGSVALVLMGGLSALSFLAMKNAASTGLPQNGMTPKLAPGILLAITFLIYIGPGVWGIVSAIGLWRLRNWARRCFVIFGGLLGFFSFCGAFVMFVAMRGVERLLPPQSNVSPGALSAVFAVLLFFSLIGLVLGLWWLIYFTRRAVRVRFVGEAAADLAREFPLSMSFVAWLLIAGGVIVLIEVVFPYPLLLFGFILRGWSARVLFFVFMLVSFAAGIGMLKKRPEGHWLAVGYFTFGLLNVLSYLVVPNAGARLMDAVREISPGTPLMGNVQELYMKFGVVLGLLGGAIILWLLITRRHAFNRVSG